jgi:hypothetical protein
LLAAVARELEGPDLKGREEAARQLFAKGPA